jgi:dihydrofolate reductase
MRKIIVIADISLDGVVQAPGARNEDTSGGFKYGGWIAPYLDKATYKALENLMKPTDILLGRKTFQIFAEYWPKHADNWPGINDVTKYVVSRTMKRSNWKNTAFLNGPADIRKLKSGKHSGAESSDIKVWGSGKVVQLLLKNDLVDELWLKIYPLTLGRGKKLFEDGPIPAAFTLLENTVTPSGVIIAHYKRAGKVKTGTVG